MKKIFVCILLISFSFNILCANNINRINQQLSPLQAFNPKIISRVQGLTIEFNILHGYYLYKNKFQFEAPNKINFKKPIFSKYQIHEDDFFGKQEILRGDVSIDIPYKDRYKKKFNLNIQYQGCADKGICYNIANSNFVIDGEGVYYPNAQGFNKASFKNLDDNFLEYNFFSKIKNFTILQNNLWINLIIFFVSGLGFSFTACMYPIIPIISSIILGHGKINKFKAFILSLSYVQGIAIAYIIIGLTASLTGNLLISLLQKPIFILISDILIFILSLSMFGFFNIQTPIKIQNYLNKKSQDLKGGKILTVLSIGILSALVIGPCIGPVFTFILSIIAINKNHLLGTLYLYFLASGIGLPIILLCVFGINFLPKSGRWLEYTKIFFGFVLLFICINIAKSFLPYVIALISYCILFIVYAITLMYYSKFFNKLFKILSIISGLLIIIYSLYFFALGIKLKTTFMHNVLALNPNKLHKFIINEKNLNHEIKKAFLKQPNEPVYIEFYASWCISCVKMQMQTLNTAYVQQNINMERFFIVDVTQNTNEQQVLLKKYKLFGPGAIFILNGNNKISEPLIGFATATELIRWINQYKP